MIAAVAVVAAVLATVSGCPDDSLFASLVHEDSENGLRTYAVTYDGNGATSGTVPETQTKTEGIDLVILGNTGDLTRMGDDFAGWNTSSDGSGTDYAGGAVYSDDTDLTLYAKWMPLYQIGDA
ncbi:MAG: hypothetical protein EA382_13320, partial [Spirochaetaceae bacterium]